MTIITMKTVVTFGGLTMDRTLCMKEQRTSMLSMQLSRADLAKFFAGQVTKVSGRVAPGIANR